MKKSKMKIVVFLFLILTITGCATPLTDKDKNPVKNKETGQSLTKNIICQPTSKETIRLYEKHGVKIDKLPKCSEFKISSGKYEGIWTNIFIRPLAFILLLLGTMIGNYAVSLIIISLLIRFIFFPLTKKTALQTESMKLAQPELDRLKKKYENKKDQASMTKQSQEMMAIYKKYNISPLAGCLFSLIQLPLLFAFFEAIQRTPALFEEVFLGLQLGTSPIVGVGTSTFYAYILVVLLIGATTYFSFKLSFSNQSSENSMGMNMKMMPIMMTGMIIVMGSFMPTALGIYWITTNVFTIVQTKIVKRSREKNGKK